MDLASTSKLQNRSYSFIPRPTYSGNENTELRLRIALNGGGADTDSCPPCCCASFGASRANAVTAARNVGFGAGAPW